MTLKRLTQKMLRETVIGFLLAGVTSSALFTSFLFPVASAQAASSMCYAPGEGPELRSIAAPGKQGGVKLDQAATFLAGVSELTGAYYDEARDQIVFIGKEETAVPKFDKDDLAVAIKAIFFAEANPGVKIEYPVPEQFEKGHRRYIDPKYMHVNYMPSKYGDKLVGAPNYDTWANENEQRVANTPYGIEDTAFAKVLFEADLKLKKYFLGFEKGMGPEGEHGIEERVSSSVPNYKPHYQRWVDKNPDMSKARGAVRVWMSPKPGGILVDRDQATNSFVFKNVAMQVTVRDVLLNDGSNADEKWRQAAEEFAQHHTEHFDEFAAETPAYGQVKRLAQIVGVVKWLKDNAITTDFQWARHYEPGFVDTPNTTNMILVEIEDNGRGDVAQNGNHAGHQHLLIGGGTNYFEPLTYQNDSSAEASGLKQVALASQPTSADFHWEFNKDGQTFEAIAVSAELFRDTGAYDSVTTDLAIDTVGDIPLAFSRHYVTQASERAYAFHTSLGRGWDALPARLTDLSPGAPVPDCVATGMPYRLAFETQRGDYETFTYSCTGGSYQPDDSLTTSRLTVNADGTYVATTKNLTAYTFDLFKEYGEAFRLRIISDRSGNPIHYAYLDKSADLTKISDDHGHFITLEYADGQVAKISDHAGRSVSYAYDAASRLVKVTDVLGRATQYGYDSKNRLAAITNPAGQDVLKLQYNDLNKVTAQTDAQGRIINMSYDEGSRTVTAQDSTGLSNQQIYDDKARLVEAIDALGKSLKYTYGSWLAPETVTDKRGNVTRYQYDARGNVTKITAPDGSTVDTAYSAADFPTKITDNRYSPGRVANLTYDPKHNLTKQEVAGVVAESSYDQFGNPTQIRGPLGQTTSYQHNNIGLPTTVTDSLGSQMKYEYDTRGFLTKQTDPAGAVTTFTYDAVGKVLTATDAAGTTTYTYDNLDRVTKVTLPDGTFAQYTYNSANQISKVTDAKGNNTTYTYDLRGNLLSRKTAVGSEYKTEFDALSRPVKQFTPMGKVSEASYDAAGNPVSSKDAKGQVTNQTFDVMSRPTQSTFSDQSSVARTYDLRGNLLTAADPAGQVSFTYDQFDRVTQNKDPFNNTVNYTYDAAGRRTSLTYPSGQKVNYAYNANDQLTSVTDWNNQATQLSYHANSLLKEKKLANGITEKYDYDSANRLSRLTYVSSGGQVLGQTDIERSPVGNITRLIESGPFFTNDIGSQPVPPPPGPSPSPTPPPEPPFKSGIEAHWRLKENNGPRFDSSPNENHLSDNNSVLSSGDHKEGMASADLEADSTQYLSITDNASLSITGDLTLAGWVKLESLTGTDPSGHMALITKSQEGGSQMSYHLAILSGGKLTFFISPDGAESSAAGKRITSQTALAADTWYHLAVTYTAGQSMKIFINGDLDVEDTAGIPTGIFDSAAKFMLGAHDENGTPSLRLPLDGLLDDVFVYSQALTADEIDTLIASSGNTGGGPPTGGVTTFTYDALGQLLKGLYPDGKTYDYTYNAIGSRTTHSTSSGQANYTYDADAKLTQGGTAAFNYDENGALKHKQDGNAQKFYTVNSRHELSRVGGEAAPPESYELEYAKQTDSAWNIDIGSYSAPVIVDLNADGKLDLLIGESDGVINHYEQVQASPTAMFTRLTEKLAGIDIGSYSTPDLVDIDGDEDLDLFIGKGNGEVAHYKNTGTKTSPAFTLAATKFGNIDIGSDSTPRFADIDADGDFDFFIGKSDGTLVFYKNTGSKTQPAFTLESAKYLNIDVGSDSAPVFTNTDSDTDLDLIIGKSDGTLVFYQNKGTPAEPNFQLQAAKYQNIDVGSASLPFFRDLTGDNLPDLLIGESGGKLRLYNATKKTISLPDPGTKFKYDALGNRISKTTSGTETRYVNDITGDLPYVLAELNSSNQPQSLNLYAGGLTSFGPAASNSRLYPLTDALGNIRFLTNSSGTLVARYSYDPYGNIRKKEGSVNSTFTFSGEQFDPETSLTFLRARYYDSSTGTFLSRDPVLGPLDTPLEHGEYLYARNNPVNLSDPSGELVRLVARKLNFDLPVFGTRNPGTHYYIEIFPDNPGQFPQLNGHATLGGYPSKDSGGNLVKGISRDAGLNNIYRRGYDIASPNGNDADFINSLLEVYSRYGDDRKYWPFGNYGGKYNGNSNNLAWSLLVGAGVDANCLESLPDPFGIDWAPGWGTALPEMIQ